MISTNFGFGVTQSPSLEQLGPNNDQWQNFWISRMLLNLIGYATIILPVCLVGLYLRCRKYNERAVLDSGFVPWILRQCFYGSESSLTENRSTHSSASLDDTKQEFLNSINNREPVASQYYILLGFYGLGLQITYLTWGYLQERIMMQTYGCECYTDSQFLVFANRVLACLLATSILTFQSYTSPVVVSPISSRRAALVKYSYSSVSNILSSWCQYEALKFVSFPTQVLAKASKIIPVMLIGRVVNKESYQLHEYLTAALISAGVALFLLTNSENRHPNVVMSISGALLLMGYILFDSFTSNWQDSLFKKYSVSSIQMMAMTSMWSCLLTITSLLQQGQLTASIYCMVRWPQFAFDVLLISLCSALGQMFTFFTISRFGAVIFVILMTIRQVLAILLSCIIYSYPVTWLGGVGIGVVFLAIFLRIWLNRKFKKSVKSMEGKDN